MHTGSAESRECGGTRVQSIVHVRYVAAFAALNNHRESLPPVFTGGYALPQLSPLSHNNGDGQMRFEPRMRRQRVAAGDNPQTMRIIRRSIGYCFRVGSLKITFLAHGR